MGGFSFLNGKRHLGFGRGILKGYGSVEGNGICLSHVRICEMFSAQRYCSNNETFSHKYCVSAQPQNEILLAY